jgi:FemAB-related protein (PEP-CTERM system-associated)
VPVAVGAQCPWHTRDHSDLHLAHAPEWAAVIAQAYGHAPMYFAAEGDAGHVGFLPAFVVRRPLLGTVVTSMPFLDGGGPCATSAAVAGGLVTRLVEESRRLGARLVDIRSARRLPVATAPMEHKVNLVLPLTSEPDEVWKRVDRAGRSQIRKAERSGLSIDVGGAENVDDVYPIFATRMHELGSPVHAKAFFDAIAEYFGPRARVIVVRKGSTAIGGLIALAFNHTMTVPWASCLRQYSALCPNMLLYWEAIRAACLEGFARFDFGRSALGSGTFHFKRQWGAEPSPLYWYSIPIPDDRRVATETTAAEDLGIKVWRRLPPTVARRLGPHVRKYLIQ